MVQNLFIQNKTYVVYCQVITSLLSVEEPPEEERVENIVRLKERHFMEKIPPTPNKVNPQKRCRVCTLHHVRKDSRFHCPDCPSKPGLCMDPCYKVYHTVADLANA